MIVWTQQRLEFWEELNRNGIAYCNQQSWLYREYGFAYDWLTEQMRQRLGEPPLAEIKLPLWCWVQYASYKCKKPKFRPNSENNKPYAEVYIEADIPDEMLLQSNFNLWAWHCLNGWQIGDRQLQKEIDAYNDNNGGRHNGDINHYPQELRERIAKSWQHIFDLNYRNRRYHNQPKRNTPIQATFWLMRKEWVRSVRINKPKE